MGKSHGITIRLRIQRRLLDIIDALITHSLHLLIISAIAIVTTVVALTIVSPDVGIVEAVMISVDLITSNSPYQHQNTWSGYQLAPLVATLMWITHVLGWLIIPTLVGAVISMGQEQVQLRARILKTLNSYLDENRIQDRVLRKTIIEGVFHLIDNPTNVQHKLPSD